MLLLLYGLGVFELGVRPPGPAHSHRVINSDTGPEIVDRRRYIECR